MDLLLDWDLITSHSIELFFLYHFIIISCVQACLSDCYNSQPSFVMFCPSAGRLESKDRIHMCVFCVHVRKRQVYNIQCIH
jgi:hypothetical protein